MPSCCSLHPLTFHLPVKKRATSSQFCEMLLNVATLFLGLLGLEAHIRGVSARPHISLGRTGHKKRQDISLSNTSSCNDVEYYQTQNGLTRIQADMYDLLNAQSLLDTYLREKAENTELADSVDSLLGAVDGLVPLPDDFSDIGNTFLFDDYVSGFAAPYVSNRSTGSLGPPGWPFV